MGWMRCGTVECPGVKSHVYLYEELLGICVMKFGRVGEEGERVGVDVDIDGNSLALEVSALQFCRARSELGSRPDGVHDGDGPCLWEVPVLHDEMGTSSPLAAAIRVSRVVSMEGS